MIQKGFFVVLAGLVFFVGKMYFQNEEQWIQKKTKKLIQLVSSTQQGSEVALLKKASKITRFIHFDVRLKVEYQGSVYARKSLNEVHSLLFLYFKQKISEKLEYGELNIRMSKNNKQADLSFPLSFKNSGQSVFCQAFLKWIKEKKWYIKEIEVSSCSYKKN